MKKVKPLNFEELDLNGNTLEEISKAGLKEATPIQQSILSAIKTSESLIIKAENNDTDKQAAIAIAALDVLFRREDNEGTAVLIISSSPGSASAIHDQLIKLGVSEDHCLYIDKQTDTDQQTEIIANEQEVIIATPSQLYNLLRSQRHIFHHVKLLVLDSLDEIIDQGEGKQLNKIQRRLISEYKTLVCTNEFNKKVKEISSLVTRNPSIVGFGDSINGEEKVPPAVTKKLQQYYIKIPPRMKISTLLAHIEQSSPKRCVIFTASKRGTDRLYQALKKQHLQATSLHGKLSEEKRAQRFSNFANGNIPFLLVADISAAELDLKDIDMVINYDVPGDADEYRFRAALLSSGSASHIVSLVSKQDRSDINEIQKKLDQQPEERPLPEQVQKKLKKRRQNKSNNGQQKKRKKQKKEMELPQPNYEKLSGGRSGNHDEEKNGIVKFFKKLFNT